MQRLTYLDGLKGWCAISVCIFHFLLMFAVDGFVGWKCMPQAQENPVSYYFANFPYSVLTNNSFPLYIFFAILSNLTSGVFPIICKALSYIIFFPSFKLLYALIVNNLQH